jgi:L-alanine-DL-glutamate epimerase-like enolase superfamily enzyme
MQTFQDNQVKWLEAPLPLENLDGYKELEGLGIPIGGGDLGMTTRYEFADMILRGKANILQPDVTMVGGLSEMMIISSMAKDAGRRIVPHGYKTNILIAINLNFLSQHWEEEMIEYSLSASPLLKQLTNQTFSLDSDGMVSVPMAPGLGVTLNENALSTFRVA